MSIKFTNNMWWKLLSVLFAIIIWFYVINEVDPIRSQPFKDIPVQIRNEEKILNLNQHVNYLSGTTVDVTIEARRTVLDSITRDDITAVADMSKLSITDTVVIDIYCTKDFTEATAKPSIMKISREGISSMSIMIDATTIGEPASGFVAGEPRIQPNMIEVVGPESKIAQIKEAIIEVDITNATDNVTYSGEPKILDSNGNEVMDVVKSTAEVSVEVPIYKTKEVPLVYSTEGELPEGYKLLNESITPKTIIIKGPSDKIDSITKVDLGTILLSDVIETPIQKLNIPNALQAVSLLDNTQSIIAEVSFEIKPLLNKELTIPITDININNLPEGLQFSYISTEDITLTFQGLEEDINNLDVDDIRISANLRNLEVGIHKVEANVFVPVGITLDSNPPVIEIELLEEQDITETSNNE